MPVNSRLSATETKGIVTSLAGPFSNVLMALVCLVVTKLLLLAYYATGLDALAGVFGVFSYMVSVNLSLAVFNLIPLPPARWISRHLSSVAEGALLEDSAL